MIKDLDVLLLEDMRLRLGKEFITRALPDYALHFAYATNYEQLLARLEENGGIGLALVDMDTDIQSVLGIRFHTNMAAHYPATVINESNPSCVKVLVSDYGRREREDPHFYPRELYQVIFDRTELDLNRADLPNTIQQFREKLKGHGIP